jgi:RNase adapter protein RapZ
VQKVILMSFAFGAGIPDSSMMFNARFLKPPAKEPGFMDKTGLDKEVGDFIRSDLEYLPSHYHILALTSRFLKRYYDRYTDTPIIAIGCTGGQHRSVYCIEQLAKDLRKSGYQVTVIHRELANGSYKKAQRASDTPGIIASNSI